MKGYIIIILILGFGALTSYWGITSDKMAKSFVESPAACGQAKDVQGCEKQPVRLKKFDELNRYQLIELDPISSARVTFSGRDVAL